MAEAVAEALTKRHHLIVEAGTGVGKSFAYLIPALLESLQNKRKAIVSTHTITLQEQLHKKDIPLLFHFWGDSFQAALLKGRHNYLCPIRLERALRHADSLFTSAEYNELTRIHHWAVHTQDGTLSDLDPQPDPKIWQHICSEAFFCTPQRCSRCGKCFYHHAKRRATEAQLLILNHSLLFLLLAGIEENLDSNSSTQGYLFTNDFLIIDEAHTLENVATRHLGWTVSRQSLRATLHRLFNPKTQKGLLPFLRLAEPIELVKKNLQSAETLFHSIDSALQKQTGNEIRIHHPDFVPDIMRLPLTQLIESLRLHAQEENDEDNQADLNQFVHRLLALREGISQFLAHDKPDHLYWIERGPAWDQEIKLNAAPIEIAPLLSRLLFKPDHTTILTSATLAPTPHSLDYFVQRIGALHHRTLQLGSPFHFEQQMRIFIPRHMPDPSQDSYQEALAAWIRYFTAQTQGHAFVLFTNQRLMQTIAEKTAPFFAKKNWPFLCQGTGMTREKMLQTFKKQPHSILFGLDSFWQGVDVPGEALSNVIITRLPFPVPDQPIVQARCEIIENRGGNPFSEYSLPEAILKFRQGVGRLIRSHEDRGIVCILDPRILSRPYGREFIAALPQCPVEILEDQIPLSHD